jgi:uncharacterized membrane protein
MGEALQRRGYLDWIRGLGVLIMIQAHVLHSWTQAASSAGQGFRSAVIIGGLCGAARSFSRRRGFRARGRIETPGIG